MGACTRHETGKQEYVKIRLAPIALVRKLIQTAGGGTQNRPKATLLMGKSEDGGQVDPGTVRSSQNLVIFFIY